jgi:hypothetical protein
MTPAAGVKRWLPQPACNAWAYNSGRSNDQLPAWPLQAISRSTGATVKDVPGRPSRHLLEVKLTLSTIGSAEMSNGSAPKADTASTITRRPARPAARARAGMSWMMPVEVSL